MLKGGKIDGELSGHEKRIRDNCLSFCRFSFLLISSIRHVQTVNVRTERIELE